METFLEILNSKAQLKKHVEGLSGKELNALSKRFAELATAAVEREKRERADERQRQRLLKKTLRDLQRQGISAEDILGEIGSGSQEDDTGGQAGAPETQQSSSCAVKASTEAGFSQGENASTTFKLASND